MSFFPSSEHAFLRRLQRDRGVKRLYSILQGFVNLRRVKIIAKDINKTWLHKSNESKYFYTDDLDDEIIDLIHKA